jgi:hypothetical protein
MIYIVIGGLIVAYVIFGIVFLIGLCRAAGKGRVR